MAPQKVKTKILINFDLPGYKRKLDTSTYLLGTIHPFHKTHRSLGGKFTQEFLLVSADRRSWKILLFGLLNLICTGFLLMWCSSTNSMGCKEVEGREKLGDIAIRGKRHSANWSCGLRQTTHQEPPANSI
ncbi:zinc transporter 6-like [Rhincodon typus]|uniref:zinc transporter 6-like n=1 Tax=Rhincodon typus TaxID=259920 RepID=UPI00202DFA5C|nr:zinc transporter 6-like [Rhincodon typus]